MQGQRNKKNYKHPLSDKTAFVFERYRILCKVADLTKDTKIQESADILYDKVGFNLLNIISNDIVRQTKLELYVANEVVQEPLVKMHKWIKAIWVNGTTEGYHIVGRLVEILKAEILKAYKKEAPLVNGLSTPGEPVDPGFGPDIELETRQKIASILEKLKINMPRLPKASRETVNDLFQYLKENQVSLALTANDKLDLTLCHIASKLIVPRAFVHWFKQELALQQHNAIIERLLFVYENHTEMVGNSELVGTAQDLKKKIADSREAAKGLTDSTQVSTIRKLCDWFDSEITKAYEHSNNRSEIHIESPFKKSMGQKQVDKEICHYLVCKYMERHGDNDWNLVQQRIRQQIIRTIEPHLVKWGILDQSSSCKIEYKLEII